MNSPLIIFNGESNSGGFASNTAASPEELSPRSSVKILNPIGLQFEDLDIGTNNLLDHAGLSLGTHGWELELANQAASNRFGKPPIYLVKTGQGGSTIDQWVGTDQTYWNKFLDRVNAAKTALAAVNYVPIFWYTQGINDAISGTNTDTWKAKTIQHFGKIRAEFPGVKILYCEPPRTSFNYSAWLPLIQDIVSQDSNCYFISSVGASVNDSVSDPNHWGYEGMKVMAKRLVSTTVSLLLPSRRSELLLDFLPSLI